MIIGIGLDMIEVERIERAVRREAFRERIYAPGEIEALSRRNWNAQSAAGAFAAKEAVSKALGTGVGAVGWTEIAILHDGNGRPWAELSGRARERFLELGARMLHVSITHLSGLAAAQAILEK